MDQYRVLYASMGGRERRLGNNPLVMAVPSADGGEPLQLDMAMSQYSYGKLQVTRLAGEKLPYPGGFDDEGNLTDDPRHQSSPAVCCLWVIGRDRPFVYAGYPGSVLTDGIGQPAWTRRDTAAAEAVPRS